jgi:hypothetical protein
MSASLKVSPNRISRQSSCDHDIHSDGSECGELSPPSSPTQYYHPTSPGRQKGLLGVISGLPCSLGFSTSTSNLCEVTNISEGSGVTISINRDNFIAGSIVIYRTALIGTKEESKTPRNGISIPPVHQLQQLLGLNDRNRAMSFFNKISYDLKFGPDAWFNNYDDLLWPCDLKESVKELEMEDINIVLFRSSAEENDMIGIFPIFDR